MTVPKSINVAASRWPHRWAWLLTAATFPLIWWGGFVTTTDAGMAFRDWLTSDGHFMLTYPWLSSTGDKFIEHGHRLLAVLVGILTIGMVVVAYRCESRTWVRRYSLLLLAGVILQGVLGGLRIVLDERLAAMLHGCSGPLFFALCTAMVVFTSRWWQVQEVTRISDKSHQTATNSLARLAIICCGLAYLQLVVGAAVRHARYLTAPSAATIFQTAIYFHIVLAFLVLGHVLLLALKCFRQHSHRGYAVALSLLLVVQIALGMATWVVRFGVPVWATNIIGDVGLVNVSASTSMAVIITAHVATGSLIVAMSLAMALRTLRQSSFELPKFLSEQGKLLEAHA
ncbi:COX15/CtaA family protein [Adhaeretor mobilis]|uniref:Heme A synthase n=1 Tax=Adhaeretor mobilis TaxID=1930276 RepID=A0A517MZ68_9BACT|nr:COX15/CtaA family protein [Adhaeretor mobilis]QDT00170.1 Heme A synthase [Adhaeretor mobilis]